MITETRAKRGALSAVYPCSIRMRRQQQKQFNRLPWNRFRSRMGDELINDGRNVRRIDQNYFTLYLSIQWTIFARSHNGGAQDVFQAWQRRLDLETLVNSNRGL